MAATEPTEKNSTADFAEAQAWVIEHQAEIPASLYNAIMKLAVIREELAKTKRRASNLLALFRTQLGVIPKSERSPVTKDPPSKKTLTDEEKIAALKNKRAKLTKEIREYEYRLGKGRKKRQKRPRIARTAIADCLAEIGQTTITQDTAAGQIICDLNLVASDEQLFSGKLGTQVAVDHGVRIDRVNNFENPCGLHASSDDRMRHEFNVTTKTYNLKVETVTDPRTGKSVTASTDDIGPPNSQATWVAIANTVISVVGYAIPINRLAKMLTQTNPYFTSSRLCSFLELAAGLCVDIYEYLGEAIADCNMLLGDDTRGKVLEIDKHLKDGAELMDAPEGGIIARLASVFGRVFPRKRGSGHKRQLNVSVLIGKLKDIDPRSYVFFFRTHLGSLGDLLSKILDNRSPRKKDLTLVSDSSTTNLLRPDLYQKFNITHAGCTSHARRAFWRQRDKDKRLCYWMLSAFLILEQIEDQIDDLGRTQQRVIRYRGRYSAKIWVAIRKRCISVVSGEKVYGEYWPKNSKIFNACEYILNHYEMLTANLTNPALPITNNLSERILRWDKIMEDASKFRKTEAGRVNIDILRTIVHTCSAAGVELSDYLLFIFKNRQAITENPQEFTPYAFALKVHGLRHKRLAH